ncbi:MAG: sensor histidine kinase [Spirochaetales bacterium]|nr:sensor histidine kinase [Spirochaetales bacterium]
MIKNRTVITFTSLLCLVYLGFLFIIDNFMLVDGVYQHHYYIICAVADLLVLAVSLKGKGNRTVLIIFSLLMLSLLPLILSEIFVNSHRIIGDMGNTESILLRNFPLLLLGLILLVMELGYLPALGYIFLVVLIILGENTNRTVFGLNGMRPFGFLIFIYIITFLIIGFYINRLVRQLEKKNQKLADYAATREELAVSRERNRMARELHDTLAHTLSALSVQLETAKAYQEREPETAASIIDNSLNITREGLKETRLALKALRASSLENLGLLMALEQLLLDTEERSPLVIRKKLPRELPPLAPSLEQCLYRICQEGINNVLHHANAELLTVELQSKGGNLKLILKDDGLGFDSKAEFSEGHYGIRGMKERAEMAGGKLIIDSKEGEGTELILELGGAK